MARVVTIAAGVLILTVMAAGLTEVTLALGREGAGDDARLRPAVSPSVSPSSSPPLSPTPTPIPLTPTPTPSLPTAITNSFVHLRAGKSTATPILMDFNGGTVVQLLSDSDSQWQQVEYNGTVGYVFKAYLSY